MILLAVLLQAVQPMPPTAAADIQLDIVATARRVVVESRGRTSLTVRAALNGSEGDRSLVEVDAPTLPQGQRELRDVNVRVHAEAHLPDAQNPSSSPEPRQPR